MVVVGFVMAMTAPIELLYAIKLGLSTAEVTVFIMVSALGAIVIDVLGTRVITRIDARATIAIGLVLFAASEGFAPVGCGVYLVCVSVVELVM